MQEITVLINGEKKEIPHNSTIAMLLRDLGIKEEWLGVAVNMTFIPKEQFETTTLKAGDEVDILAPMSGG